ASGSCWAPGSWQTGSAGGRCSRGPPRSECSRSRCSSSRRRRSRSCSVASGGRRSSRRSGNLLLLAVIFLGASYGVVPITRWAGARTARELEQVMSLLVRALPLLILFITFIFLQNEAWQITAGLHGPYYWIVLGLFILIGVGFSVIRLPREIGELSDFESWDVVVGRVDGTPASALVDEATRDQRQATP